MAPPLSFDWTHWNGCNQGILGRRIFDGVELKKRLADFAGARRLCKACNVHYPTMLHLGCGRRCDGALFETSGVPDDQGKHVKRVFL